MLQILSPSLFCLFNGSLCVEVKVFSELILLFMRCITYMYFSHYNYYCANLYIRVCVCVYMLLYLTVISIESIWLILRTIFHIRYVLNCFSQKCMVPLILSILELKYRIPMLNYFIAKNHNFSFLKIIILNVSLYKLFINKNNIPIHIDLFLIIIILSIRKLYPQILFVTQVPTSL